MRRSVLLTVFAFLQVLCDSHAFLPTAEYRSATTTSKSRDRASIDGALSCICINCKWVTSCAAYHFVETKHEQPHMTEDPTFEPRDGSPTIHVNIRTIRPAEDREAEIQRMWQEHEAETKRAEERAADVDKDASGGDDELHGEQVYDFAQPMTTYEYDVVKCEDFIEDAGCWVRNMPEEIRNANPDFVPS